MITHWTATQNSIKLITNVDNDIHMLNKFMELFKKSGGSEYAMWVIGETIEATNESGSHFFKINNHAVMGWNETVSLRLCQVNGSGRVRPEG